MPEGCCGGCIDRLKRKIPTLDGNYVEAGQSLRKIPRSAKIFLGFVTFQVTFLIAICVIIFVDHHSRDAEALAVTWIVSALALEYFVIDTLKREDELVLAIAFSTHVVVSGYALYAAFDRTERESMGPTYQKLALAVSIETSIASVLMLFGSWNVRSHFGWFLHNRVGVDPRLQQLYKTYNMFHSILKLDVVVSTVVLTLSSFLVLQGLELILDIGALVITILFFVVGYYGVREETRAVVYIFISFCFVLPVYIVWRLFELRDSDSFGILLVAGFVSVSIRLYHEINEKLRSGFKG
ncbi:hypothetical protein AAMO2058_001486400 [Amorphochlora amoebiformis]